MCLIRLILDSARVDDDDEAHRQGCAKTVAAGCKISLRSALLYSVPSPCITFTLKIQGTPTILSFVNEKQEGTGRNKHI